MKSLDCSNHHLKRNFLLHHIQLIEERIRRADFTAFLILHNSCIRWSTIEETVVHISLALNLWNIASSLFLNKFLSKFALVSVKCFLILSKPFRRAYQFHKGNFQIFETYAITRFRETFEGRNNPALIKPNNSAIPESFLYVILSDSYVMFILITGYF